MASLVQVVHKHNSQDEGFRLVGGTKNRNNQKGTKNRNNQKQYHILSTGGERMPERAP
jgi:hypothetical protein